MLDTCLGRDDIGGGGGARTNDVPVTLLSHHSFIVVTLTHIRE